MKKIPLSKGKFALVDDEDFEFINQWRWNFCSSDGYAKRTKQIKRKNYHFAMHRVINKTPKGIHTDHIDGNKLNNQKKNLRNATNSQNMMNSKSHKDSSSRYKGVSWDTNRKKWHAQIYIKGHQKNLGNHSSEKEAALKYNSAAIKYHGKFARLNEVSS